MKHIGNILLIFLWCLLFWGCDGKSDGITLTILGSSDDTQKPYLTKIIQMYENKTGNRIQIESLPNHSFENLAQTKFRTGCKPDIFMHFGNNQLDSYFPEKNFYDLSNEAWVNDINDMILPQCKRNGKVYGLPFWEASISGCFYNKKIFKQLNIKHLPKTQEEFDTLCDFLLSKGIQPIYMAMGDTWPILYQLGLDPVFADKSGEKLIRALNANEIRYADIPEFRQMLLWFKKAAEKNWFGPNFINDKFSEKITSSVLNSGKAAMIFCWDSWFYTDFRSEGAIYDANDFGIMPVFMGTKSTGTFEGPNTSLLLVNKAGKNLQAALDFIRFAATPENYNLAFESIGTLPVFRTQTSNILSFQYIEAESQIKKLLNDSNAIQKIIGFSQNEGGIMIKQYLNGKISLERCIALMDGDRIATIYLVDYANYIKQEKPSCEEK